MSIELFLPFCFGVWPVRPPFCDAIFCLDTWFFLLLLIVMKAAAVQEGHLISWCVCWKILLISSPRQDVPSLSSNILHSAVSATANNTLDVSSPLTRVCIAMRCNVVVTRLTFWSIVRDLQVPWWKGLNIRSCWRKKRASGPPKWLIRCMWA